MWPTSHCPITKSMKFGLPPVVRADARVLILGSLPGDASLAAGRYYAHPRNQFWALLSGVTGHDLVSMFYSDRLETLQKCGIALWDVIASAERQGSLDGRITASSLNDLRAFAANLPILRAIVFNGKKAAMLGKHAFAGLPAEIFEFPSSSPAHAVKLASKVSEWKKLAPYILSHK